MECLNSLPGFWHCFGKTKLVLSVYIFPREYQETFMCATTIQLIKNLLTLSKTTNAKYLFYYADDLVHDLKLGCVPHLSSFLFLKHVGPCYFDMIMKLIIRTQVHVYIRYHMIINCNVKEIVSNVLWIRFSQRLKKINQILIQRKKRENSLVVLFH